MKRDKTHRESTGPDPSASFLSRAKIPWEKSKEEVWRELSDQLQEEQASGASHGIKLPGRPWIALAASITLLLAVASFMRFHVTTVETLPTEHTTCELPDGSLAELNAVSTLSYHPYWWWVSREVKLEGEAYFKVENGSKFTVRSETALTEVLGTTFNVYSRGVDYRVVCHSGKVMVSSRLTDDKVLLTKEMQASLETSGLIRVINLEQTQDVPGWKNKVLTFSSVPLKLVFEEVERQYGIRIHTPRELDRSYSGNFALDASVENVLTLLCLPFDLRYEQTSGNSYTILPIQPD